MSGTDYDAMTEDELIAVVRQNSYMIEYIKNPSEAVCLTAVEKNGLALQFIKNPTERVQLAAVSQNAMTIKHLKNPGEVVCMTAIAQNEWSIRHIHNPSEAVQIAALMKNNYTIKDIKNPAEAVQAHAVRYNPSTIACLPTPVCDAAVVASVLHYPFSPYLDKNILDRAPEILDAHCAGLGDVYMIGLSIGMSGEELSRTMIEWIENHAGDDMTIIAEMAP